MAVLILWSVVSLTLTAAAYAIAFIIALLAAPFHLIRWLFTRLLAWTIRFGTQVRYLRTPPVKPAVHRRATMSMSAFELGRAVWRGHRRLLDAAPVAPESNAAGATARHQTQPTSPRSDAYLDESERLFAAWLNRRPEGGPALQRIFQMEHAPEPYLLFGEEPRLVFVTTNPGGALDIQRHPDVEPTSIFRRGRTYAETAAMLGRYYADPLGPINANARSKNIAMSRIAKLLGYRGVLQVETLPWHSATLPKHLIGKVERDDPVAARYTRLLAEFLRTQKLVLSLAVGKPEGARRAGVDIKARILGLDMASATMTPLKTGALGDVSQALFCAHNGGRTLGIFVNQGSDKFPAQSLATDAVILAALRTPS